MVKRIDELTEEQKAKIPGHVEKWTKIGLSTEPADWETSKKAIAECYRFTKLEPPRLYIKVPSPLRAALVSSTLAYLIDKKLFKEPDVEAFKKSLKS